MGAEARGRGFAFPLALGGHSKGDPSSWVWKKLPKGSPPTSQGAAVTL